MNLQNVDSMTWGSDILDQENQVLGRIREIKANPQLGVMDRRRLGKEALQDYSKLLQVKGQAALQVERERVNAGSEVACKMIAAQKVHCMTQLQARFNTLMGELGGDVFLQKLEQQADLGEKLTLFRKSLENRSIDERFLGAINAEIDRAFEAHAKRVAEVFSEQYFS